MSSEQLFCFALRQNGLFLDNASIYFNFALRLVFRLPENIFIAQNIRQTAGLTK
ncbi:MAG: hypothetical protein J5680_07150 [Neisseriaceae bacterium]|nr:hypothetical protein [Neisseriaceae bacterium]